MKTRFCIVLLLIFGLAAMAGAQPQSAQPLAIPLKPDPPPAIDGDLGEWTNVPNAITLNTAEHVTYNRARWTGPSDLSATIWLAWRPEHLYLAADVTDDRIRQSAHGVDMWQGDHLELYLDTTPDAEPDRKIFGKGQFQLGFSPGNFGHSGDPLTDLKPEAAVFSPAGISTQGVLVAAKRTEKGYTLEAAIPWSLLGVKPGVGTQIGIEAGISDTDSDTPEQKSMMTISASPLKLSRDRLVAAILAPADGKAPAIARGFDLFPTLEIKPGEKKEFHFDAPAVAAGHDAVLSLKARLASAKPAGYTGAMRLSFNGKLLDAARLLNKKPTEDRMDGASKNMMAGDRFNVDWSPDFDAPDTHPNYGLKHGKVTAYDLRVTDLLKVGTNTLVIENTLAAVGPHTLVVGAGRLEFRGQDMTPPKQGPPTGPLPIIAPQPLSKVKYSVQQHENNDLLLTLGSETFHVESQFSTPEPKWQKGSNRYFSLRRQIERRDEAIIVRDTFTNLTTENLPLMQRHRVLMPLKRVWLGGLSPSVLIGSRAEPGNPTSFGITEKSGVGLMPLDDVSQVHVTNFSDGAAIALADNNFVLPPGKTHTAQWAIVLTPTPDYFAFVNAVRRLRDANFKIDGGFAFLRSEISLGNTQWSDELVSSFIRNKSAKYLCISISYPRYKGKGNVYAHGTAFQTLDLTQWKKEIARRRRLAPDVQQVGYFHCFLDESDDADKKYPDARVLRPDGAQGDYGNPWEKLFLPTETNSFGRDVAKDIDVLIDDLHFDGVYWDEMERSRDMYTYGEPWDGVSADIDPQTMKITRLKGSVTLLSQTWRIAQARRVLTRGPLIANGQPYTPTMAQLHFPRFVETGSLSNCVNAQLFSPIALGDSLTEQGEVDAYQNMLRALDYGCVYYWYNDWLVRPTYPTLTRYMFPITPIELHDGYILGRERIITHRSGLFGWNDTSGHEIHVFDDQGREVKNVAAPVMARMVTRGGKNFTELRLPEDWSAAIVRK